MADADLAARRGGVRASVESGHAVWRASERHGWDPVLGDFLVVVAHPKT